MNLTPEKFDPLRDWPAVLALEHQFPAPWSREDYQQVLDQGGGCWVVRAPDTVNPQLRIAVGCCWFEVPTTTDQLAVWFEAPEIISLVVAPQYRVRGLGRQLLAKALESMYLAGCKTATLHVRPVDVKALRLYLRAGFRTDEFVPDYYAPGSGALRLSVRLPAG